MTRAVPAGIAAAVVAIAAIVLFQLRPEHVSATAEADATVSVPAGATGDAGAAAGPAGAFSLARTEQHARATVRQRPADAQAHHYLALALHAEGRLNDAVAAYRAALRIDPGYQPAADALRHAEAELAGDFRAVAE